MLQILVCLYRLKGKPKNLQKRNPEDEDEDDYEPTDEQVDAFFNA
jgi:hypothetical protein